MKYLPFVLIIYFINIGGIRSQSGLTIDINAYSNNIQYFRDGMMIHAPTANNGENIYVVLEEFNPYTMKAVMEVESTKYNQDSGGALGLGLSGLSGFSGITSLFGGLNLGSSLEEIYTGIPKSRGAQSLETGTTKASFMELTSELKTAEEMLNASAQKIELFNQVAESRSLALNDIDQLRRSKYIKPSRIKHLMEEEIQKAFAKNIGEDITTNDLVNPTMKRKEIEKSIIEYEIAKNQYIALAEKWKKFITSVGHLHADDTDDQLNYIIYHADSIGSVLNAQMHTVTNVQTDVNALEKIYDVSIKEMSVLRLVYEELQSDIFKFKFPPVQAQNEELTIKIKIYDLEDRNSEQPIKEFVQLVSVNGGWKITGGLGMAFGAMFHDAYDYSVVNDVIKEDKQGDFFPSVVSFAHLHKMTNSNTSIGGSFGVGFPLQSGTFLQSLSFFLGPTVIFGKNQKFLLTGGLMGSKVNRLSGGFGAGDYFEGSSDTLPTKSVYELGYFMAISYNLVR